MCTFSREGLVFREKCVSDDTYRPHVALGSVGLLCHIHIRRIDTQQLRGCVLKGAYTFKFSVTGRDTIVEIRYAYGVVHVILSP